VTAGAGAALAGVAGPCPEGAERPEGRTPPTPLGAGAPDVESRWSASAPSGSELDGAHPDRPGRWGVGVPGAGEIWIGGPGGGRRSGRAGGGHAARRGRSGPGGDPVASSPERSGLHRRNDPDRRLAVTPPETARHLCAAIVSHKVFRTRDRVSAGPATLSFQNPKSSHRQGQETKLHPASYSCQR